MSKARNTIAAALLLLSLGLGNGAKTLTTEVPAATTTAITVEN